MAYMREIMGVPIHPLLGHVPIVLFVLLALLTLLYLLVPPVRQKIGWSITALAVLTPASVYAAKWSGTGMKTEAARNAIDTHSGNANLLLWLTIAFLPVWLLFGALERGRRTALARHKEAAGPGPSDSETSAPAPSRKDNDPAAGGRTLFMLLFGAAMLGIVGWAGWCLYQTWLTGANMAWGA